MHKNGADATDIGFVNMRLADRNLQIDFNKYSGHSTDGLISLVQKFHNKFAGNEVLMAALKVALGRDWDLL
jgi:hypothetical protein